MGLVYREVEHYLPTAVSGVLVEIGSDRGEGSTAWLAALANRLGTKLISVDMDSSASQRLAYLDHVNFVVAHGSTWAKNQTNLISCLYLDNFDYIWNIDSVSPAIQLQMSFYADRGLVMTNAACQIEHMRQLVLLYPWLTDDAVIMFDDTYKHNDCWIGKNGPGVVWLLAQGWKIAHTTFDCGVVLSR